MSFDYLGEIRMFAGAIAPSGWALCDGRLLSIADNQGLFTLIGTTYGGDGLNTFAVPDLRGRLPVHPASGQINGEAGGVETVTLDSAQLPRHNHAWLASTATALDPSPQAAVTGNQTLAQIYVEDVPQTKLAATMLAEAGQGHAHDNVQPFTCVNFIIALYGIVPHPGSGPAEGDPYLGEIRIFPFYFFPRGWHYCDGSLQSIASDTALYSILGTAYGGDGVSTFALPDLRGRAPMDYGDAPGLSPRQLGAMGGAETVALDLAQIPSHGHDVLAASEIGDLQGPGPSRSLARSANATLYAVQAPLAPPLPMVPMAPETVADTGASGPHNNMQPYLTLNFCIAMDGEFPHP